MAKISETELQKRLRKLEASIADPADTVVLTDDQYTLSENVIYVAYASALSNLVNGTIPNQSDATDFQYSPYNATGVLMAYRGYFSSTSIYQSGDPTDYLWESTSGLTGFTSSERYYTTSTGLLSSLGNPTEPGAGITWTVIASGNSIPSSAVWVAERYTVSDVTSGWSIDSVAAYVNSDLLVDNSVTDAKLNSTKLNGIETNATADQSNAEIKTAYEANANSNEFSDAEQTKLTGIETSATADQTGAQIKTAYEAETNAFTDAQFTKLAGIETSATADQTQSDINALGITATSVDLGDWTITESVGILYFATSGVNKMKLDASGNATFVGTVTESGTI